MQKILLTVSAALCFAMSSAQIVINEIDSDTPSTDTKEFIEIKSETPYFPLDGYVLVLFNGNETSSTGNKSYFTLDLDGLTTDVNGLTLIGAYMLQPVADYILPENAIQNGPDVAALYLGNASDWPPGTLATSENLIDAVAHHNAANGNIPTLMGLLGLTQIYNEHQFNNRETHSIQRKNDGTYEVKLATPGVLNDGSGVLFNGITIDIPETEYVEGSTVPITFTTQNPVSSTLTFTFSLNSGSFTAADYSGSTTVSIPAGQTSVTANILLVDDDIDEGDEIMKVTFGTLPSEYKRMNDKFEIYIIDNDYAVSAWGTPLQPTYGIVSSTAPAGYYASLEGKTGEVLKQAIQDIIADPATVHGHTYGDVTIILKEADQNPANNNEVWLMYVEQGRAKYKFQTVSSSTGLWNREHIFPQSRGGFANGTADTPDGINVWFSVSADDITAGHGDAHHIRAEDGPENSSRNNRDYGTDQSQGNNAYNGPANTQGSWRGDVARALFYMATRYNALSLVNGNPPDSTPFQIGDLATLLVWNNTDPADDFEMNRNNVIYTWQQNRNPFIDHPELAEHIWGSMTDVPWFPTLSTDLHDALQVGIYPNPTSGRITVSGLNEPGSISIYNVSGAELYRGDVIDGSYIDLQLSSGVYITRITSGGKQTVKKLLVK
jgi:hypothetical protein